MTLVLAASFALIGQPIDSPVLSDQDAQVKQDPPRYNRFRRFQLKDLEIVELKINVETEAEAKKELKFKCWVMDTFLKRQEGMMFLEKQDVSDKQGMIFAFNLASKQSFWMKNTYIPLDIAYLDANGKIVKTYTMRALDTYTDYTSVKPAKYVLEVNKGVFKKLGIKVGMTFELPKELKAKN